MGMQINGMFTHFIKNSNQSINNPETQSHAMRGTSKYL